MIKIIYSYVLANTSLYRPINSVENPWRNLLDFFMKKILHTTRDIFSSISQVWWNL